MLSSRERQALQRYSSNHAFLQQIPRLKFGATARSHPVTSTKEQQPDGSCSSSAIKLTGAESQVHSSTQVEMIALISPVEHVAAHAVERDVNIDSDILSSLNFLNPRYWKSSLSDTKQRLRFGYCRAIQVCSISLSHLSRHSGIWQNELADRTAKAALTDLDIVNLNGDITATSSLSRTFTGELPTYANTVPFPEESLCRQDQPSSEARLG